MSFGGERDKLHEEKFCNLYSSPDIISLAKSKADPDGREV
jgi:hypothetical protein